MTIAIDSNFLSLMSLVIHRIFLQVKISKTFQFLNFPYVFNFNWQVTDCLPPARICNGKAMQSRQNLFLQNTTPKRRSFKARFYWRPSSPE